MPWALCFSRFCLAIVPIATYWLQVAAHGVDPVTGFTVCPVCGLAVYAHPGSKGRSATDGDIEVPALMLFDLYTDQTYMDTLYVDADALDLASAAAKAAERPHEPSVLPTEGLSWQERVFREQVIAAAAAIDKVPPPS